MLQLGTPSAPTAAGLRPYLRQFLSDPRVIEAPAWVRWLLVNLIIVPFRSPKSAAKYRRIWDDKTGSPLLSITQQQRAALAEALGPNFRVHYAMRYGEPSTPAVVKHLVTNGCEKLVVLPMYPQYSATTTASALDALFDALKSHRVMPGVRIVRDYYLAPEYIEAVCAGIRRVDADARRGGKTPDRYLLSFHGIPRSYIRRGDPYMRQSILTAKRVARQMGWTRKQWQICFQSRLGPSEWLIPYTDETLKKLGADGVKTALIAQPGFTADCLETIDEIGHEGKEEFQSTGGQNLIRVPCLNADPEIIVALKCLVERETAGWR